jgi:hypothetical protein
LVQQRTKLAEIAASAPNFARNLLFVHYAHHHYP